MKINFSELIEETKGWIDIVDITDKVGSVIKNNEVKEGFALIYTMERDTALITLEAEMALILDMADLISSLVEGIKSEAKGDVASALLGTYLTIPIVKGYMDLGTWQQIMLVDLGMAGKKRVLIQSIS